MTDLLTAHVTDLDLEALTQTADDRERCAVIDPDCADYATWNVSGKHQPWNTCTWVGRWLNASVCAAHKHSFIAGAALRCPQCKAPIKITNGRPL